MGKRQRIADRDRTRTERPRADRTREDLHRENAGERISVLLTSDPRVRHDILLSCKADLTTWTNIRRTLRQYRAMTRTTAYKRDLHT
jgi:hypothetical protein